MLLGKFLRFLVLLVLCFLAYFFIFFLSFLPELTINQRLARGVQQRDASHSDVPPFAFMICVLPTFVFLDSSHGSPGMKTK